MQHTKPTHGAFDTVEISVSTSFKAGVHPKVVSERLGHATIGVTLDLYSHVTPSIARDAADVVAAQILSDSEGTGIAVGGVGVATPWLIQFFQRHTADDSERSVPAIDFLDQLPTKVVADIRAVLDAVAEAPPPAFSGGGMWEAMHGEMAGFYEVRVTGAGMNHRLFCVLERDAADRGSSSIIVIDGLSKPKRSAAKPRDYRRALALRSEFQRRRTVLD